MTAPAEIFERVYDDPIDSNGADKPNQLLGTFTVEKLIIDDTYRECFIGVRQEDRKKYLINGFEVSGRNGGMRYHIIEI